MIPFAELNVCDDIKNILMQYNVDFVFQPIFDRTGDVFGYEALMRPEGGKNVLDYIERIPLKTEEDISQEIKWCEKMLLRTMRGDVEGYYRWHWVLCDSLEIYFDIKGIHYYGPKKALHFMEESDSEAFHIYSKALLEFNQEGLSDWINYLKTIF